MQKTSNSIGWESVGRKQRRGRSCVLLHKKISTGKATNTAFSYFFWLIIYILSFMLTYSLFIEEKRIRPLRILVAEGIIYYIFLHILITTYR